MPAAQQQVGQQRQHEIDRDAGGGDQHQGGEHARDAELVAGFEDAVGEARGAAAGAGHELGHHRADQGEAAGDAQAAQEVRQCGGQAQVDQRLPAAGAVELEQRQQVAVDRAQAEHGVGQDREERHQPGADQQREIDVVGPGNDQRRDGHDRRHLQDDGVGKEREFYPPRQREQDRQQAADDDRRRQRLQRDFERDDERGRQHAPVVDQRAGDQQRPRQHIGRNPRQPHDGLPQPQHGEAHDDGSDDAGGHGVPPPSPNLSPEGERNMKLVFLMLLAPARGRGWVRGTRSCPTNPLMPPSLRPAVPRRGGSGRRSRGRCGSFRCAGKGPRSRGRRRGGRGVRPSRRCAGRGTRIRTPSG